MPGEQYMPKINNEGVDSRFAFEYFATSGENAVV